MRLGPRGHSLSFPGVLHVVPRGGLLPSLQQRDYKRDAGHDKIISEQSQCLDTSGVYLPKKINELLYSSRFILLRARELTTEKRNLSSRSTRFTSKDEAHAHETAVSVPDVL